MTVQTNNRLPLVLAVVGVIFFIGAVLHQTSSVPKRWKESLSKVSNIGASGRSFYEIAMSHGTDKVTDHHYHHMYQKYLEPLRNRRLKVLEIGLGCDMNYGPGASYYTWLEYLPNVDLYYIEYDAECAQKWANKTSGATIFTGDQADIKFLNRFMAEAGQDFDIIIDDGGHTMNQQMVSLSVLWKAVMPGGIYFCEDLQTSYKEDYGGDEGNTGNVATMMLMVKELLDDLNVRTGGHRRQHRISADMLSIDCMEEVCAFVKKETYVVGS